jgi:hypothetical protein
MDHEHSRDSATGCKVCETRPSDDFGQGSREQSFRGLATPKLGIRKTARG